MVQLGSVHHPQLAQSNSRDAELLITEQPKTHIKDLKHCIRFQPSVKTMLLKKRYGSVGLQVKYCARSSNLLPSLILSYLPEGLILSYRGRVRDRLDAASGKARSRAGSNLL